MDELKPCPCGCDAKLVYESGESYGLHNGVKYTSVKCSSCSFSAGDTDDWNNRADGWISVEDKPFSANQTAIVYINLEKGFYMNMVTSNDEGDLYDMDGGYIGYHASQITHLMPLPAPPKAEK